MKYLVFCLLSTLSFATTTILGEKPEFREAIPAPEGWHLHYKKLSMFHYSKKKVLNLKGQVFFRLNGQELPLKEAIIRLEKAGQEVYKTKSDTDGYFDLKLKRHFIHKEFVFSAEKENFKCGSMAVDPQDKNFSTKLECKLQAVKK